MSYLHVASPFLYFGGDAKKIIFCITKCSQYTYPGYRYYL